MSNVSLTIDDASPLITYQPPDAWTQHNIISDPGAANQSYQGTFTSTKQPGAIMTFTFEGVAIVVYGSTDVDHGDFTVNLDGQNYSKDGAGPLAYKFPLFVNDTLSAGTHTLTISTRGTSTFVIDYLTWNSSVNVDKTGSVTESVVDDADSAFERRQGDWPQPSDAAQFFDGTGHSTKELGATMALSFAAARASLDNAPGDAIALYGSVGPENGVYSIQLDNMTAKYYSASTKTYAPQSLLHYDSNIGPGNHSLLIINQANDLFEIDYATVYTLPSLENSSSTAGATNTSGASTNMVHHSLSGSAVIGITVGAGVAAVLVLLICFLLYLKRMKNRWAQENQTAVQKPFTLNSPSTVAGDLRSFRNSKSTIFPPESPGKSEMRKTNMFDPGVYTPSIVSNDWTVVADDGSNASVHMPHGTHRPKRKLNHLEGIFQQPARLPRTEFSRDSHVFNRPISEAREAGDHSDYDISYERESSYSTRAGTPPPSVN